MLFRLFPCAEHVSRVLHLLLPGLSLNFTCSFNSFEKKMLFTVHFKKLYAFVLILWILKVQQIIWTFQAVSDSHFGFVFFLFLECNVQPERL